MDTIETNFNKSHINTCTDRCIVNYNHSLFSPDEFKCIQKYICFYSDVPEMSSNH